MLRPNFLEFGTFSDFFVRQNRVKLKVSRKVRRLWNKKKSRKTEIRVSRTRVKRGIPVFYFFFLPKNIMCGRVQVMLDQRQSRCFCDVDIWLINRLLRAHDFNGSDLQLLRGGQGGRLYGFETQNSPSPM